MAGNWNEYAESTTIHGARFLNSGNSRIRRVIWLLFVLSGFVFFAYQFWGSMRKYLDYGVNTIIYRSNDLETKFPAITICNQNTLRKSKVEADKDDPVVQQLMGYTRQYLQMDGTATNISGQTYTARNTTTSGKQLREVYFKHGHTMQNRTSGGMLRFCRTPKGEQCTENDFYRTFTFSGLCYTLNSGKGKGMKISSTLSGRFAAVLIVLSAQVDEYSEAIGKKTSTGIMVMIHDQKDPPIADTHGMFIGPGMAAAIAVRKQKVESLKAPYTSKCRDEELFPGYPYSRSGCFRKCQEKYVLKECKCSLPLETIGKPKNVPLCDINKTFNCAIPKATVEFSKVKATCDCPYACESVEYSHTLSYSQYPTDIEARTSSIKELQKEGKNTTEEAIQKRIQEIRKNYIQLEVFYQQMDYLTIKAVPASSPVQLFAEIGGLLGISLGASFLTIIELIDFLVILLKQRFTKEKVITDASMRK